MLLSRHTQIFGFSLFIQSVLNCVLKLSSLLICESENVYLSMIIPYPDFWPEKLYYLFCSTMIIMLCYLFCSEDMFKLVLIRNSCWYEYFKQVILKVIIPLYSMKIKVKFIKGGFLKFPNDSKGIDKGCPKNIQIFKGGENNKEKFQFEGGSKKPGRNHEQCPCISRCFFNFTIIAAGWHI